LRRVICLRGNNMLSALAKYVLNRLIHGLFHIALVISPRLISFLWAVQTGSIKFWFPDMISNFSYSIDLGGGGLWCLMPLSTIFLVKSWLGLILTIIIIYIFQHLIYIYLSFSWSMLSESSKWETFWHLSKILFYKIICK
jgi:hypothetical protein